MTRCPREHAATVLTESLHHLLICSIASLVLPRRESAAFQRSDNPLLCDLTSTPGRRISTACRNIPTSSRCSRFSNALCSASSRLSQPDDRRLPLSEVWCKAVALFEILDSTQLPGYAPKPKLHLRLVIPSSRPQLTHFLRQPEVARCCWIAFPAPSTTCAFPPPAVPTSHKNTPTRLQLPISSLFQTR